MTIALANSNPIQELGNGTTVTYSFPWKISAASDLLVGFIVGGVYTLQGPTTYTVSGVGNDGGGSITFTTAPAVGVTIDLRTETPLTQPTVFANLGAYLPENTTNSLDRVTRAVQDLTRMSYTYGIHGPDNELTAWTPLPGASSRAGGALVFDNNGLPTIGVLTTQVMTGPIIAGLLTPTLVGPLVYPIVAEETQAGVTPQNFAYPAFDVRRYGWTASDSVGMTNYNALTAAINVASAFFTLNNNAATVTLPQGNFTISGPTIIVPPYVWIAGAGMFNTVLNWNGSGYLFQCGNNSNQLSNGCAILDLRIELGTNGICSGILLYATQSARLERVYVEGPVPVPVGRVNIGVGIDGANISAFFNRLKDVYCNHVHVGLQIFTSGSLYPTCQYLDNVSVQADKEVDAGSIGINLVGTAVGTGSVVTGGDLEHCGTAIMVGANAGDVTWVGVRMEVNTTDVNLGLTCSPQKFFGCRGSANYPGTPTGLIIIDNSGAGFDNHTYVGCVTGNGNAANSTFPGTNTFQATRGVSDVPVIVQGYPGQTSSILQVQNSAGTTNFQANPQGSFAVWGATPPAARVNGFGAPTGAGVLINFPGASATLPQCSQAIAQLEAILLAYGIIGS